MSSSSQRQGLWPGPMRNLTCVRTVPMLLKIGSAERGTMKEDREKALKLFEAMWKYRDRYGDKYWAKHWAEASGMTVEETQKKYEQLRKEIRP